MNAWFYSLDARERLVVGLGVLSLLLMGVYLLVIEPTSQAIDQASHRVIAREAELARLQQVAHEYEELKERAKTTQQLLGRSLLSFIDQSSESSGIKSAIKRLTPEGDSRVRVHFENAEFNPVISWLISIYQQQGIRTEMLNIRKTDDPGVISGTVMLAR